MKVPFESPNKRRFRTVKDILIPAGTRVVYIARMKQEVLRTAQVIVSAGPDKHYEWLMHWDDALENGLIEEVK
ncbi:MAG: hypothetical protein ABWY63_00955 [Hyphomicrobiaceae bacterium]